MSSFYECEMSHGCVASHDRYGSVTLVTALVTEEYPQLWVVETDGELKIVREDELYDYGY